jgi:hypothetical protein
VVVVDSWFASGGYIARTAYRVGMLPGSGACLWTRPSVESSLTFVHRGIHGRATFSPSLGCGPRHVHASGIQRTGLFGPTTMP